MFGQSRMRAQTVIRSSLLAAAILLTLALPCAFGQHIAEVATPQVQSADQGCVNQGSDRREFAPVICWMQRQMSWKSEHEPYFALLGKSDGTNLGLAWPPYVVFNIAASNHQWRMFRAGFRYDRTWRGYIFPTIAMKRIAHPLRY
jgi:hypothetical protein